MTVLSNISFTVIGRQQYADAITCVSTISKKIVKLTNPGHCQKGDTTQYMYCIQQQ